MKIVKVKSIKKIENSSKRYDIQTKMTNNFFANGILVHNCTILYYDQINEKWAVQTLGQIEAEEKIPGWGSTGLNITWARLFWDTFEKYTDVKICNKLDKNYSYIFEMCTPYNKVVVKYETSKLVFIGMRSKVTLMEAETKTSLLYDLFDKPKEYKFENLKEIKRVCSEVLTDQEEGFVIIGDGFKRVKMKSLKYVSEHYNSTVVTIHSLCHVVFQNEQEEYVAVFTEFKNIVEQTIDEIKKIANEVDVLYKKANGEKDKKLFSEYANKIENAWYRGMIYGIFSGKFKDGYDAIIKHRDIGERKKKVDLFLRNSNVKTLFSFNPETGSLK